jgi:hypothetical protein
MAAGYDLFISVKDTLSDLLLEVEVSGNRMGNLGIIVLKESSGT